MFHGRHESSLSCWANGLQWHICLTRYSESVHRIQHQLFPGVLHLLQNLFLTSPFAAFTSDCTARANVVSVVVAMGGVLVGLLGNVLCNLNHVRYFALYFLVCLGIIFFMLYVCLVTVCVVRLKHQ